MKACACCKEDKPLEEFYMRSKTLRASYCKSCTSVKARKRHERSFEDRLKLIFNNVKYRSGKQKIPFNLEYSDLIAQYKKQNGKCYYTGEDLTLEINRMKGKGISIDKIIPENGYTLGNVALCSWRVNQMKFGDSYEEFVSMCKKIAYYYDSQNV